MRDQIKGADVICVVYAIDDSHTFQRLGSYWLPLIQSNNSSVLSVIILTGHYIYVDRFRLFWLGTRLMLGALMSLMKILKIKFYH